jgi:hypothetical protein
MAWQLNSTKIFVQKIPGGVKQIISKLQPLDVGTVFQAFGYETNSIKLSAITVGTTNRDALRALTTTGSSYALLDSNGSSLGNFYVASVTDDRINCISQTLDLSGGLTCDSPVFNIEMELSEDV